MPASNQYTLSVLVMTYNEELNLGRCLASVHDIADEILVLDSYSTDQTVEVAKKHGARVEQFPFDSYIQQKARMIQMADSNRVLCIDADEYLSDELKASIKAVKGSDQYDAYTCNRRNKIGDQWIRYGSWYPDRKIRLFDRRKVNIIGNDPHDVMEPISGARVGHLKGDLMHESDADIASRFATVERHSTRAAAALFAKGKKASLWRMIFKPCFRFINSYVFRLGFLDGYYGWIVARSEWLYVWLREVKLWEKHRQ